MQVPAGQQKKLSATYVVRISAKKELVGGNRRSESCPSPPSSTSTSPPSRTIAPVEFKAPIVEVTVLEDRAATSSAAPRSSCGPALTRLRIAGVAPVMADKTLCAAIVPHGQKAGDGARERVSDVRVRRSKLVLGDDKPERARELQRERERLSQRLAELQAARELAQRHETALSGVGEVTIQDIGVDVCYGRDEPAKWAEALERVAAREGEARQKRQGLDFEVTEVEHEIKRLNQRIGATSQVSDAVAAEVVVEVWVAAAGVYAVQVDYVVPGACWRPPTTARSWSSWSRSADPVLHFSSEGCVWQNTGEDWSDVQLIFSTERPSLGTEPPQLVQRRAVRPAQERGHRRRGARAGGADHRARRGRRSSARRTCPASTTAARC